MSFVTPPVVLLRHLLTEDQTQLPESKNRTIPSSLGYMAQLQNIDISRFKAHMLSWKANLCLRHLSTSPPILSCCPSLHSRSHLFWTSTQTFPWVFLDTSIKEITTPAYECMLFVSVELCWQFNFLAFSCFVERVAVYDERWFNF